MTAEKKGKVRVGLLGLGTVGGGVYKALQSHRDTIRKRTGYEVEVVSILVRELDKERALDVDGNLLTLSPADVLNAECDIVIEVMGGVEPARTLIHDTLAKGRHVITANKELIAKHGATLLATAEQHGVHLLFEASVAGGIPVIRMLQGYLTANRVKGISGILNGTCNYILTEMARTGREFADILKEAQQLGYAEADSTSDVEGFDAAYKLAILTNLAYEAQVDLTQIERHGITSLQAGDLQLAEAFGYSIKLIGNASEAEDGSLQLSVRPRLVPQSHPLANIHDVFNAVTIQADVVGELTFSGRGAGEFPTASAVIEDLTALLCGTNSIRRPSWTRTVQGPSAQKQAPSAWYVSYSCQPEEVQVIEEVWRERLLASGGSLVSRREVFAKNGGVRQGWIIEGALEQELGQTLQSLYETGAEASTALLLPVDGEIEPGVEWKQPVPSRNEVLQSLHHAL